MLQLPNLLATLSRHCSGGELRIEGLGNVGRISEAEDANLKRKQDLTDLSLSWYRSGKSKSIVGAEEVLEALQPHSTLKLLTIRWYEGLRWPTWMENNSATHSLVSLRLVNCGKCKHLPPVGKLPFLKKLEVIGMDDVQYIEENESYDGVEAIPFPSLEELFLSHLANVERLMKRETTHMFPSLSKLHIYKCPKLQLPCLPSVKDLTVWECSNEQLKSISNLNGLNQLHLDGCDEVSYFQEGMMNMTSLATLQISDFRRLKELPFDITKLTALSDLSINKCYNLECLPEQGWEDLSSLRHLSIIGCYRLGSLPDGVRHLASLQSLTIGHCPVLEKRCEKGTGEDWHKIAHVPHVEFPRF
ncbi:putative disease resistance protein RGA1 isoform X1 [Arachis hypogaea]|nr:putative disease resistance protein RGA1 isoform X1 [Arachis hypogaea]